jgi:hypothetical protein
VEGLTLLSEKRASPPHPYVEPNLTQPNLKNCLYQPQIARNRLKYLITVLNGWFSLVLGVFEPLYKIDFCTLMPSQIFFLYQKWVPPPPSFGRTYPFLRCDQRLTPPYPPVLTYVFPPNLLSAAEEDRASKVACHEMFSFKADFDDA